MDKIYFKEAEKAQNLVELLNLGFTAWGNVLFVETFSDAECTVRECKPQARRSFEDLLAIGNTYFPETTPVTLMLAMTDCDLSYTYCPDIKKIVFHRAVPRRLHKGDIKEQMTHIILSTVDVARKIEFTDGTPLPATLIRYYELAMLEKQAQKLKDESLTTV